jgi:hypothetical protein
MLVWGQFLDAASEIAKDDGSRIWFFKEVASKGVYR